MSTRTSSALALLLLAGCNRAPAEATPAATTPAEDVTIDCALHGAGVFARECSVERVEAKDGVQLVVRHPDGGFRRFDVLTDGKGLAAADGAQDATVTVRDGGIDVTVGADRYRFPATVTADGRR
jgi:hypothetical protein